MKTIFLKISLAVFAILISVNSFSQIPPGYYDSAEGLEDEALRQALHNIIDGHDVVSYGDLWEAYEDTDKNADGKVWDMYSNCVFTYGTSDQCGNYSDICDCFNREHTVPQSWFGESSPMVSDMFHVYPTDGKVNGYRSHHPFGECSGTTYGTGKVGSCTYPGYTGTVFEPADEYKGDMARSYFYMATRYMDVLGGWSGDAFSGDDFSLWTRNLMLDWHHEDPVSVKEINRNNAVYVYQDNRNPFIDNPVWADAIWDPTYTASVKLEYENIVSIFPNPADNILNISINDNIKKVTGVKIVDITGKVIYEDSNSDNNRVIDVNTYPNAVYFIHISFNSGVILSQKFVVL